MNFVMGVTNFNRLSYLKKLIETWNSTKSDNDWTLIIADDGSETDTLSYLNNLLKNNRDYDLILINRKDVGVHNLTNLILKEIDGTNFDFCFKADNDIYFKKSGWDIKYYKTAIKTGYHHLIYNGNKSLNELEFDARHLRHNYPRTPIPYGCFFTITQDIIDKVGFFDIHNFGKACYGHQDYSVRCAISGFNETYKMYDIGGSKQYIEMQGKDGQRYVPSHRNKFQKYNSQAKMRDLKKSIIKDRIDRKREIYCKFQPI
ncbi:MAG: glycosyltransferase [Novosphingobium sp.]|nr:glycosyltransferase [Novosphingobium sp.]